MNKKLLLAYIGILVAAVIFVVSFPTEHLKLVFYDESFSDLHTYLSMSVVIAITLLLCKAVCMIVDNWFDRKNKGP